MSIASYFNKLSLRKKMIGISLTTVFTLTGVGELLVRGVASFHERDAQNSLQATSRRVGGAIGVQFFERYGDVQAFALNEAFRSTDREKMRAAMNEYTALYGIYDLIALFDADGKFIAANDRSAQGKTLDLSPLRGKSFSDASWFNAAVRNDFLKDPEAGLDGSVFEDAQIDPLSSAVYGTPMFGVVFAAPVRDQSGKLLAVLTTRANFSFVEDTFRQEYDQLSKEGITSVDMNLVNAKDQFLIDYSPASNEGKVDVERDFKQLLRETIQDQGFTGAHDLGKAPAGNGTTSSGHSKQEEFFGHAPVAHPHWPSAIAWGVLISGRSDEILAEARTVEHQFMIAMLLCAAVFLTASWFLSTAVGHSFIRVSDQLRNAAQASHQTSGKLARASGLVAASSTEQAAAVQETVSSMSEISSMISQTSQHVKECTEITQEVTERTDEGGAIMRRLVSAMEAIQEANAQLQAMAGIINEVSSKTMVINDIVFKTQLLSINASIEAARAGQHGKGFSVVAEEVGNLAQMSGAAAKEIQTLIQDSQRQVAQIIETTQARVGDGEQVSSEAMGAFNEIARGVQGINERVLGISQATKEQQAGIQQIATAMNQMDTSTQRNRAAAEEASDLAQALTGQSVRIERVMRAIRVLILGDAARLELQNKTVDVIDAILGETPVGTGREHAAREAGTNPAGPQAPAPSPDERDPRETHGESPVTADDDTFHRAA